MSEEKKVEQDERYGFEQHLRDLKMPVLPVWKDGRPYQSYTLEKMWDTWCAARAASTSSNVARLPPDAEGTDAARRYLAGLLRNENGSNQYADYIRHELSGDFAWELVNRLLSANVAQGAEAVAFKLLAALIDILDDADNNAPEDRCYVEGAWKEALDEARSLIDERPIAKSSWHPDFVTAMYENSRPDKLYTMDQMREYADAFHRSRIDADNVAQGAENTDDIAVDSFARAMKEKMAAARAKGRSGWEGCEPADLSRMLREHIEKGDPRDVANFCMMLWHHSAPIAPPAPPALTDAAIEAGWHQTFSTNNPYCPCNLKSFTKAVQWAERALTAAQSGVKS